MKTDLSNFKGCWVKYKPKYRGSYIVEYWDTGEGECIAKKDAFVDNSGFLTIKLPLFMGDLALKVTRK